MPNRKEEDGRGINRAELINGRGGGVVEKFGINVGKLGLGKFLKT